MVATLVGAMPRSVGSGIAHDHHRATLLRTTRLFDDFLKVDEGVIDVDGQVIRRLSLERGDSVAGLVLRTGDRRVLLTRQFRYPTMADGPGWITEVVAGVVEHDESPEDALRREMVEEIGYTVDALTPIATFYVSPGGSSERIHLFYAEVSEAGHVGAGGGLAAEGEVIEIVEMTIHDLRSLLVAGAIDDAKTLIGVMWLLARG